MIKRKKFILLTFNYLNFIILSFQQLLISIVCDNCDSCPNICPPNCKNSIINEDKYYECSEQKKYYYIFSNVRCVPTHNCPDTNNKIVYENKECVVECKYSYQLGDLYYKNIDSKIHLI